MQEDIKFAKEFWMHCYKSAIGMQGELATIVTIIFAILTTIGVTGIILSFAQQNYNLLFMLIPLGVWFFIIAPVMVWKRERVKVLEYEKVDLELIAENSGQYIHQRGHNWIFRVGIKVRGKKTVNNVEAKLIKRSGGDHAYPDAPLRPAYNLVGEPSCFAIKPGDIKFVEVCSWSNGDKEMRIHYYTDYQIILGSFDETRQDIPVQIQPFLLSVGIPISEQITLCATGENTQPESKTLAISIEGKKPQWKVIK